MSDDLKWPEEGNGDERKKYQGPTNGQVILCTLLVFGVTAMVGWMLVVGPPSSDDVRARGTTLASPGYYGKSRAIEATPANIYEAGVVRTTIDFSGGTLVEVVVDDGRSKPGIVWVIAEGELRPKDECVMKFVDGINYRERHAFKIDTGKRK